MRWLLFVHQLPASPSNARVKTWRRLRQIGAVQMRNAVYVLPKTAQTVEDFEWLRAEVAALGGEASVFDVSSQNGVDTREIVRAFRAERAKDFEALRKEIAVLRRKRGRAALAGDARLRASRALQERLRDIRRHDFFPSPAHAAIEATIARLSADTRLPSPAKPRGKPGKPDAREYQNRTWVTRPRPGVDRFSSAWLIRRFVDARATFVFALSPERVPDAVPFDMYQSGGFRHEGDFCTFEVLQAAFSIEDPGVRRIAEIVHDLDLKDSRFNSPHAATIGVLVDGLRAAIGDDHALLQQGMTLFEALYQSFRGGAVKRGKSKIC